ncbi:hypothetical protein HFO06_26725 [Rhizobium leguminosarum]|uniref:hypothetical protein n=1 Tax=Rhizobium leguminosarum TaxID=384 RepID=UPI001C97EEA2|nr:hypothetical protein [Rhizobium leguminosarum]MBY5766653.1 hypothetical protein [Rhizobium leguminosarum]
MRLTLILAFCCAAFSGCGGKYEQLAKCSADENPVPTLGYDTLSVPTPPEQALARAVTDDCGPMRPVN